MRHTRIAEEVWNFYLNLACLPNCRVNSNQCPQGCRIIWLLCLQLVMHYYINAKGHKLELRSNKNYLTNHIKFKSFHQLVMTLVGVDTHTYLHYNDFKKTRAHQPAAVCFWFKNHKSFYSPLVPSYHSLPNLKNTFTLSSNPHKT